MNRFEAFLIENTKAVYRLDAQIGRLEERLAELKRTQEEGDRKRWTIVIAVVGSILALVANIILTVIRK